MQNALLQAECAVQHAERGKRAKSWDARAAGEEHGGEAGHAGCEGLQHGVDLARQLPGGRHHDRAHLPPPCRAPSQAEVLAVSLTPTKPEPTPLYRAYQ